MRMSSYLLASSSRNLASISLLGGYLGKLEGSQAIGLVVKNCKERRGEQEKAKEAKTIREDRKPHERTQEPPNFLREYQLCTSTESGSTSFLRAREAVPLRDGSNERSSSISPIATGGSSLNVSLTHLR